MHEGGLQAYFSFFWVNLEEGGDVLLLFSLTCLPVGSVSLDMC